MYIHDEVRHHHLIENPAEESILTPFLNGFDVTWGRSRTAKNTTVSVYFLRPEKFMSEMFGFNQEILLVYSPYESLEARAIQAAEQFITDDPGKGRVEKLTYFIASEAANAEEWTRSYTASHHESRIIVAFSANNLRGAKGDSWYVRNRLADQLFARDLFDYRLPLEKDTYFFGRDDLLLDYKDAANRGENRGLFGLRKTGKTSFLYKLERFLEEEETKVLFYDCKSPSIRQMHWNELLERVAQDIANAIGKRFNPPSDLRKYPDKFTELLAKLPENQRIALVFDEIEYISPYAIQDKHWATDYAPFWQTIWAAQSRYRKLSVVIAGVNPTIVELDKIDGIQNPLFGIVTYRYLRGLGLDEVKRMLRVLGRRMGLKFNEPAVEYIHDRYGGHPLLSRLTCSFIHQVLIAAKAKRPTDIDLDFLQREEASRDGDLTFYCRHVVSELRDFYPDEYEMLELLSLNRVSDFMELSANQEFVRHLKEYGLLREDNSGVPRMCIPVIGRYVALEDARRSGRRTILRVIPPEERSSWLERRINEILNGVKDLERLAELNSLPPLFGPNSLPESHKFAKQTPVDTEQAFELFINTCNKCFVEAIEIYGTHTQKKNYFWEDIKSSYPDLHDALHRMKVYRHDRMHIKLNVGASSALRSYLAKDLEGREARVVEDIWFILQQCVLDGFLTALQVEIARLS